LSIDKNGFWKSPGAFGNDKTDLGQVYGGSVNSQNGVLGKSMGLLSMTKHGWGQVHGGFLFFGVAYHYLGARLYGSFIVHTIGIGNILPWLKSSFLYAQPTPIAPNMNDCHCSK